MNRILIIIPAFNEEGNIARTVLEVFKIKNEISNTRIDVLVINDASRDNTYMEAKSTGAMVIDLPFNLGIGGAVQTGFKFALDKNYNIAVQVDGDGQHDPNFVPELIKPIIEGNCDMSIGSRFLVADKVGFQSTFMRRLGIRIFQQVNSWIIGQRITDNTSGFRAYSQKVISHCALDYPSDYPEPETVIELGLRGYHIVEIPVVMRQRLAGKSSISSMASLYYMVKVLLAIFINLFKKR